MIDALDSRAGSKSHPGNRIPSLDGIRAISILLVLVGHLSGSRGFGDVDLGVGDYARLGVKVFFVISGYLITKLLMRDEGKPRYIALKLFYIRRSIRIFPVAYGYILLLFAMQSLGFTQLLPIDYVCALTYTSNYCPHTTWPVGHLWSLSVEEQFYLIWPACFFAFGSSRSIGVAVIGALLGPLSRLLDWYYFGGTGISHMNALPMNADGLALGCLLALNESWIQSAAWYRRLTGPSISVVLLALLLLLNRNMGYSVVSVFGGFAANLIVALLIHRSIQNQRDWFGRILNSKVFVATGALSYSLYIWQQFFLQRDSAAWINAFPQNILLAVAIAILSYRLLEMPLVGLRHRMRS